MKAKSALVSILSLAACLHLTLLPDLSAAPSLRLNEQASAEAGGVATEVLSESGALVKAIGVGTIRELFVVDGQAFTLSFGQNARGDLVLIIAPNPEDPKAVNVRFNGRRIAISKDSVATIIIPVDQNRRLGEPLIRAGLVGTVAVDGRRLPPDTIVSLSSGQAILVAQSNLPPVTNQSNEAAPSAGGNEEQPVPTYQEVTIIPSSMSNPLGQQNINLNPAAATPIIPDQT
jgi:hypothetical protein